MTTYMTSEPGTESLIYLVCISKYSYKSQVTIHIFLSIYKV